MSDLRKYGDKVWEKIFDLVLPPVTSTTPIEEVDAELALMDIDLKPGLARVRKAVEAARARARLEAARAERPAAIEKIKYFETAMPEDLRGSLRAMIEQQLAGTLQGTYFRKLEGAASEEDLRSLLEDLDRLRALSEEEGDEEPG